MKAFYKAPKKKPANGGLSLKKVAKGEVVQLAYFHEASNTMHEFTATVIGESHKAVKLMATHGPVNAGREEFFWLPRSWELLPVPRRAARFYLPKQKCSEIGVSLVLSFN